MKFRKYSLAALAAAAALWCTAANAVPMSFTSSRGIVFDGRHGPASPYPATLAVSGLSGIVTEVSVTLHDVTVEDLDWFELAIEGPQGEFVVLFSDITANGARVDGGQWNNEDTGRVDVRFRHGAPAWSRFREEFEGVRGSITTFEVAPTTGPGTRFCRFDLCLPPPDQRGSTDVLPVFNGVDPNGQWRLWAFTDCPDNPATCFDDTEIGRGYTITIETVPITARTEVAEPSALALFGLGLAGLGFVRRKTKGTLPLRKRGRFPLRAKSTPREA